MKKYDEAADYLQQAAREMPHNPCVFYNLGQLLDYLGKPAAAEHALLKAIQFQTDNRQFLLAIIQFYIKQGKYEQAKPFALKIYNQNPNDPDGRKLVDFINGKL